ncbi:MAG: PEGA domain-containing protein [Polyangiaceae bacterium]
MRRASAGVLCLIGGLLLASPARAADDPASVEQAKALFNAGAQAYDAGRFGAAIQAFQQAYALAPRPAILFSMAQAERKSFYVDRRADDLKHAIEHYHRYLELVPSGGRRGDAADALAELEPMASRLAPQEAATTGAAPVEAKTRIMVTSSTPGARASLDDGPLTDVPLIDDVKPGKHRILVEADGYFDETREALAATGSLSAVDVPLRDRPASLSIALDASAALSIDGRSTASTPLARPLELPAGTHVVTITRNGSRAFTRELTLERGKAETLDVKLETSRQRTVAWVFFGAAGAALLAGGAFTAGAFVEQSNAQKIVTAQAAGNIPSSDVGAYQSDVSARDRWRSVAYATFGSGIGLAAVGTALWLFDTPSVTLGPPPADSPRRPVEPPKKREPMDMGVVPWVGPGLAGVAFGGRM